MMRIAPYAAASLVSLGALILCIVPDHQRATQTATPTFTPEQIDALIDAYSPGTTPERRFGDYDYAMYWDNDATSRKLYDACVAGSLTADQWMRLVERSGLISMRDRWLDCQPLTIRVAYPRWAGPHGRIRITPDLAGASPIKVAPPLRGFDDNGYDDDEWMEHVNVGPVEDSITEVRFEIQVEVVGDRAKPPIRSVTTVTRPLTIESDVAKVLTPENGPDVRKAVERSVWLETVRETVSSPEHLCVVVNLHGTCLPFTRKMAIPIMVTITDDQNEVQGSWKFDLNEESLQNCIARCVKQSDERFDRSADRSGWTLRVQGDGSNAIHDLEHQSFWSGDFTVPLNDVLRLH